jgi:hypothetical protein
MSEDKKAKSATTGKPRESGKAPVAPSEGEQQPGETGQNPTHGPKKD